MPFFKHIPIPEEESRGGDSDDDPGESNNRQSVAFKIGSPKRSHSSNVEEDQHTRLLQHVTEMHREPTNVRIPPPRGDGKEQLLVELYDLDFNDSAEGQWIETARWIKYEEDVEGYDHHWGQPHVACLFFDNIFALRQILSQAIMITDLNVLSYANLIDHVTHRLASEGSDLKDQIMELMQLRQIHVSSRRIPRSSTVMGLSRLPQSQSTAPIKICQKGQLTNAVSVPHTAQLRTGLVNTDSSSSRVGDLPKTESILYHYESIESAQVFVGECAEWSSPRLIMVRLADAVCLPEVLEAPVPIRFFLFLLGPPADVVYHEMGRSLCTMLANKGFRDVAYTAKSGVHLIAGLDAFLHESVVLPPGEIDSKRLIQVDDIKRTINRREHMREMKSKISNVRKSVPDDVCPNAESSPKTNWKLFRGMFDDIYNRAPHYRSDFTDGLSYQCLSSVIFIFLASITPAITFGGLMAQYTGDSMGMIETLLAQSICGIIWGLFAAQPLIIVSATGPVLIFEGALFTVCHIFSVDFLLVRFYAGIWIFLISVSVVAVEGSRLLKYVTAFIEEIFAVLISAIFIAEGLKFLAVTFTENPVRNYEMYLDQHIACKNGSDDLKTLRNGLLTTERDSCSRLPEPNTALLTFIVMLSTFSLACLMRAVRHSFWFGRTFRNFVGDFGVAIALIVVGVLTHAFFDDVRLQRLEIPTSISFTNLVVRKHGIIVFPLNVELFATGIGLIAAVLVFILLFVETEITELLLSRKERKLVKGSGKSWDLILIGFCALLCSFLGLPWMCAAAVQSLAHCSSLTVKEKKAPGEKDESIRVIEQRVTTIGNAILTGLFAFGGRYMRLPTASLFGVFTYLGIMNLSGVDLIQRMFLFFLPLKYYPNKSYVNYVKTSKLHSYTLIQLVLVVAVYLVKHFKVTAVAFPFALMLFIVFRHTVLPYFFTNKELQSLDGDELSQNTEENDECYSEIDFYGKAAIPV